jgi:hypothetical protein
MSSIADAHDFPACEMSFGQLDHEIGNIGPRDRETEQWQVPLTGTVAPVPVRR